MRPGFGDWTRQVLEFCMAEVTAATEWFSLCRGRGWAWLGTTADSVGPLVLGEESIYWSKEPGTRGALWLMSGWLETYSSLKV